MCFDIESFVQTGWFVFVHGHDGNDLVESNIASFAPTHKAVDHFSPPLDINFGSVRVIRGRHGSHQSTKLSGLIIIIVYDMHAEVV